MLYQRHIYLRTWSFCPFCHIIPVPSMVVWKHKDIQESIPVGCVPPACADYNSCNTLVAPVQWRSNDQVWKGLQWWQPDVTSRAIPSLMATAGRSLGSFLRGGGRARATPCTVRSNASWVILTWDSLPPVGRQTHNCENITFLKLRWRAVTIFS